MVRRHGRGRVAFCAAAHNIDEQQIRIIGGSLTGASVLTESVTHPHVVRRLYRPDLPLFRDHLVRLDADTRYNRFGLHVSDEYLGNYAELCFAPGSITYGYFEDGLIRGASELRMFASKEQAYQKDAEAAFSVEKPWRRRGIGADLMS